MNALIFVCQPKTTTTFSAIVSIHLNYDHDHHYWAKSKGISLYCDLRSDSSLPPSKENAEDCNFVIYQIKDRFISFKAYKKSSTA